MFKSEISQWVQVYASITPVVHLVNVGSESGGVQSLANVTVCSALPPIAAENFRCSNFSLYIWMVFDRMCSLSFSVQSDDSVIFGCKSTVGSN